MRRKNQLKVLRLMALVSASALAMALLISRCWFLLSDYVETRGIHCVWRYQDSWYDNCAFYYAENSSWFTIGQIVDEIWFWLYMMGALGGTLTVAFSLFLLAGEAYRRGKGLLHHNSQ